MRSTYRCINEPPNGMTHQRCPYSIGRALASSALPGQRPKFLLLNDPDAQWKEALGGGRQQEMVETLSSAWPADVGEAPMDPRRATTWERSLARRIRRSAKRVASYPEGHPKWVKVTLHAYRREQISPRGTFALFPLHDCPNPGPGPQPGVLGCSRGGHCWRSSPLRAPHFL